MSGPEIKRRTAAGEIDRDALVSIDQVAWHRAGRVKGLFAPPPPPTSELHEFTAPPAAPQPIELVRPPPRRGGLPPPYPGTSPMTFGRGKPPDVPPSAG
jgi:hypothetical protein